MRSETNDVDTTIRDAIEAHGATIDATPPDFDTLLASRYQRTRRVLASATAFVAVIGLLGMIAVANRPPDLDHVASSAPRSSDPHSLTVPATQYFCTDPLGTDQLDRALFGSCEPSSASASNDFACRGPSGTDETGRQRFERCEPVGQLGQIPGASSDTTPGREVRGEPYVVRPGDVAGDVARLFCVTVSDLEAVNGWSDADQDFPLPDSEILIPAGPPDVQCAFDTYVITEDDSTRIGVAERFCVTVEALDAANRNVEGYASFAPGLEITIPPAVDAC